MRIAKFVALLILLVVDGSRQTVLSSTFRRDGASSAPKSDPRHRRARLNCAAKCQRDSSCWKFDVDGDGACHLEVSSDDVIAGKTRYTERTGLQNVCHTTSGSDAVRTVDVTLHGQVRHIICNGSKIVVQSRQYCITSFNRTWTDYKHGFGSLDTDYWIGNDVLHALTKSRPHRIRFDYKSTNGLWYYDEYDEFSVENESSNYRLTVTGQGDSSVYTGFDYYNSRLFSTTERHNDKSGKCARHLNGGWWFIGTCPYFSINGPCAGQPGYMCIPDHYYCMSVVGPGPATMLLNVSRMSIWPPP